MKTILKANLIVIFLLLSLTVVGQGRINHFYHNYTDGEKPVEFGAKIGVNMSTFSGMPFNTKSKFNVVGGLFLDFNFSRSFYMTSGLEFANKGTKLDMELYHDVGELCIEDSRMEAMYLQIPVHAGYKIRLGDKSKLSLHAGPYVAYGLGGQVELGEYVAKIQHGSEVTEVVHLNDFIYSVQGFKREWDTFADSAPNGVKNPDNTPFDTFKKFDWGIGVGITYQYDRVIAGVNYDFGLNDISRAKTGVKNRTGYFTVGYKF